MKVNCDTCDDTGFFIDDYGEEVMCPDCKARYKLDDEQPLTIDDYNEQETR
jgi:uncharacterized protein YbaR (Trm112 family)